VLVIPYRKVPRLTDLTTGEVTDLFTLVQKVQKMLARNYFGRAESNDGKIEDGAFNVAIQDGKQVIFGEHSFLLPDRFLSKIVGYAHSRDIELLG
jgi:diadenosine tetraphosphate (Ap4A) HIT family hydrolase